MPDVGTWLCRSEAERTRVLEAGERVRTARQLSLATIAVATILAIPWLGWWPVALVAASAPNFVTLERRIQRSARPEYVVVFSSLYTQVLLGVMIAVTGGPRSPMLAWLVIPAAMVAARFRIHVVIVGIAVTVAIMLAATAGVDAAGLVDHPEMVLVTSALLVSVVAIATALLGAELQYRDESVLDPLTGALNRRALELRLSELAQQAQMSSGVVSVIAVDIDHFKAVNDTHGHDRGDAVLRDFADELRDELRSFELLYRLGGEEFVILLPGTGMREASEVAERLRRRVAAARPGELSVTASFGVSVGHGGERLVKQADDVLYRAKHAGRNCVATAESPPTSDDAATPVTV